MDLELVLQITQLIALLLFIVFAVLGLTFLNKIKLLVKDTEEKIERAELEINIFSEKAKNILDDVHKLKPKVEFTLEKLEKISDEGLKRLQEFEGTSQKVDELLISSKNTSDTYNATGLKINQKIDDIEASVAPIKDILNETFYQIYKPAQNISKFARALNKGLTAFKARFGAGG